MTQGEGPHRCRALSPWGEEWKERDRSGAGKQISRGESEEREEREGSQRLPSNQQPASPLLFPSQDGAPLVPAHIFNGSITANGLNQGTEAKAC